MGLCELCVGAVVLPTIPLLARNFHRYDAFVEFRARNDKRLWAQEPGARAESPPSPRPSTREREKLSAAWAPSCDEVLPDGHNCLGFAQREQSVLKVGGPGRFQRQLSARSRMAELELKRVEKLARRGVTSQFLEPGCLLLAVNIIAGNRKTKMLE